MAPAYRAWLDSLQPYTPRTWRQHLGALITAAFGYSFVFPGFLAMRVWRKICGMNSASQESAGAKLVSRAIHTYIRTIFRSVWTVLDIVEPLLGSGTR